MPWNIMGCHNEKRVEFWASVARRRDMNRSRWVMKSLCNSVTSLSSKYGRYGYKRITALLNQDGWEVNHKRVFWIWRENGLKVPSKQPTHNPPPLPT